MESFFVVMSANAFVSRRAGKVDEASAQRACHKPSLAHLQLNAKVRISDLGDCCNEGLHLEP
jgi:hypothetical protein